MKGTKVREVPVDVFCILREAFKKKSVTNVTLRRGGTSSEM